MKTVTGKALLITKKALTLYHPKKVVTSLDEVDTPPCNAFCGVISAIPSVTGRSYRTVQSVWANAGYGPIMYMIAMEVFGKLAPSESAIKPAASAVWKEFYQGKGKDKVTKSRIISDEEGWSDEPWLNFAYEIKRPLSLIYLVDKHDSVIGRDLHKERITLLMEGADACLQRAMDAAYGF